MFVLQLRLEEEAIEVFGLLRYRLKKYFVRVMRRHGKYNDGKRPHRVFESRRFVRYFA